MQLTTTLRGTRLAVVKTAFDSGGASTGKLKVYTGAAPGIANGASGTLLGTYTGCSLTSPSGGASTLACPSTTASGGSASTPGYYRLTDSSDVVVVEGTAGVGSGELNYSSTISSGQTLNAISGTLTEGNA